MKKTETGFYKKQISSDLDSGIGSDVESLKSQGQALTPQHEHSLADLHLKFQKQCTNDNFTKCQDDMQGLPGKQSATLSAGASPNICFTENMKGFHISNKTPLKNDVVVNFSTRSETKDKSRVKTFLRPHSTLPNGRYLKSSFNSEPIVKTPRPPDRSISCTVEGSSLKKLQTPPSYDQFIAFKSSTSLNETYKVSHSTPVSPIKYSNQNSISPLGKTPMKTFPLQLSVASTSKNQLAPQKYITNISNINNQLSLTKTPKKQILRILPQNMTAKTSRGELVEILNKSSSGSYQSNQNSKLTSYSDDDVFINSSSVNSSQCSTLISNTSKRSETKHAPNHANLVAKPISNKVSGSNSKIFEFASPVFSGEPAGRRPCARKLFTPTQVNSCKNAYQASSLPRQERSSPSLPKKLMRFFSMKLRNGRSPPPCLEMKPVEAKVAPKLHQGNRKASSTLSDMSGSSFQQHTTHISEHKSCIKSQPCTPTGTCKTVLFFDEKLLQYSKTTQLTIKKSWHQMQIKNRKFNNQSPFSKEIFDLSLNLFLMSHDSLLKSFRCLSLGLLISSTDWKELQDQYITNSKNFSDAFIVYGDSCGHMIDSLYDADCKTRLYDSCSAVFKEGLEFLTVSYRCIEGPLKGHDPAYKLADKQMDLFLKKWEEIQWIKNLKYEETVCELF